MDAPRRRAILLPVPNEAFVGPPILVEPVGVRPRGVAMPTNSARGLEPAALTCVGTAFVVLPLGPGLPGPHTAAQAPRAADDIQLRYPLRMLARDSTGASVLSGTIK